MPDPLAAQIKEIAAHRDRTLEEILLEWIDHAIADPTHPCCNLTIQVLDPNLSV